MPPLGERPLSFEAREFDSREEQILEDIRYQRQQTFEQMHEILPYQSHGKWLDPLIVNFAPPSHRYVESAVAEYRPDDLPHHQRMSAWLRRQKGSDRVSLLTQVRENVGGVWKPVGRPQYRAQTRNGDVMYEPSRISIDESPEFFERTLSLKRQLDVAQDLRETLDLIREADAQTTKRAEDDRSGDGPETSPLADPSA